MNFISDALLYLGIFLQVVLVVLLLRRSFRQYPVLFTYCITQLSTSLVLAWLSSQNSPQYRNAYWWSEVTIDVLLLLVVITQIYRALGDSPHRAKIGRILAMVVGAVVVLPFLIYYQRRIFSTAWFNGTSQLLNFGVAIMTLVLWGVLIGSRSRDFRSLTVSAGLGIAVTGSAVSFGLRQFTIGNTPGREAANVLGQFTYVLAVLVWCRAFWWKRNAVTAPPATPS